MALKDKYLTISEVAKKLEVSRQTVYRWVTDNEIPVEKIGGVTLIKKKTVKNYINKKKREELFSWFDSLYIEQVRKELEYSDEDMIEEVGLKDGFVTYNVIRKDGKHEEVKVGGVEVTISADRENPNPQVVHMKLKNVIRTEKEGVNDKVTKGGKINK